MTCDACDFEATHRTAECTRPVPDLSIHTCGQQVCPLCRGCGVVNGVNLGRVEVVVMGGDPCPLCLHTGRVPGTLAWPSGCIGWTNRGRCDRLMHHPGDCAGASGEWMAAARAAGISDEVIVQAGKGRR